MADRLNDPWVRVSVGATSTRDKDDLAEVRQVLHDRLIEDLGEHRTGPVSWRWYPAPAGRRVAADLNLLTKKLDRFLRTNPGGYLVIASAPSDLELPDEIEGVVQDG